MVKISVVTPTVRPDGLSLIQKALEEQTFKDFEWLIVCPEGIVSALKSSLDSKIKVLKDPPKKEGDVWSLNKAYNEAVRHAQGELIISWQDYTYTKEDALEKFWYYYSLSPKALVSGVGNKYTTISPTLGEIVWKDPRERENQNVILECFFKDIEANFCSIPKEAIYAVGGFDENLDRFFGMDAFSVFDRLAILGGWRFYLDQTNKTYSLPHTRIPLWEEKNAIHGPYREIRQSYFKSPVLNFL